MVTSPESESTSDSSLTGDFGTLGMKPEVEKDRTELESESSDDGICCRAENRTLEDLETIEPESETDDNNPESESEMPGGGVCRQVGYLLEDSEASISEPGSDIDK